MTRAGKSGRSSATCPGEGPAEQAELLDRTPHEELPSAGARTGYRPRASAGRLWPAGARPFLARRWSALARTKQVLGTALSNAGAWRGNRPFPLVDIARDP